MELAQRPAEGPKPEDSSSRVQDILESSTRQISAQAQANGLTELAMVTNCLYLCSASTAVAASYKVNCVVNCAAELPDTPLPHPKVLYLKVDVLDRPDADLFKYFDVVADLIDMVRKNGGKTLVHCVAGVSRSASLCLAYLMKYHGVSLRDAYFYLKSRRTLIRPNFGFFRQLISYEQRLRGKTTVSMVFCGVINAYIPDVYVQDYENMFYAQKNFQGFGR